MQPTFIVVNRSEIILSMAGPGQGWSCARGRSHSTLNMHGAERMEAGDRLLGIHNL